MKVKCNKATAQKELDNLERQLDTCCDQMELLHDQATQMKSRYLRARKMGRRSSAASLKVQMEVFMNMYNLYHQSASRRAQRLQQLSSQVEVNDLVPSDLRSSN